MNSSSTNFTRMPLDLGAAMKYVVELLITKFRPICLKIYNKLLSSNHNLDDEEISKLQDIHAICTIQIKKSVLNLLDIFKFEHCQHLCLQESRQFTMERLSWCLNRLMLIEKYSNSKCVDDEDSIFKTPMYFVNWIDYTFEILAKLSEIIYRTGYRDSEAIYQQWKNDVVECVTELHTCIDELLLSAMTLCRHCIPSDQYVVKARCQVVLRETKALFSEIIEATPNAPFKVTPDTLKSPIKPSNVNILIDVLKDVLYVLETNTNTALLALLVYCFSNSKTPVDTLKEHFESAKGVCVCTDSTEKASEDCVVVKEFDLYNERLMQIGSFAISCSSDQNRILALRSGLISLEALDPHLVPAVMVSAESKHSILLTNIWQEEVKEIRDNVFLIVDPAAFTEKSKQIMHQTLLELLKENKYVNSKVCSVINIGCILHEFFCVYNKHEPDALLQPDKLLPLLADLERVQLECKMVSNLLSSVGDFVYTLKKSNNNREISLVQLLKRLKLLYTLVNRINDLFHPKENEDQLFADDLCEEPPVNGNITRTIHHINPNTYVNTPRKVNNLTRSVFARSNVRSSTNDFVLSKLTKHLKDRRDCQNNVLSYSARLDELLSKNDQSGANIFNQKKLFNYREPSFSLAFSPMKTRSSLRRAVLNSHCKLPYPKEMNSKDYLDKSLVERESIFDETTSLQITEVLNEINELTRIHSTTKNAYNTTYKTTACVTEPPEEDNSKNILTLNVNEQNTTVSKNIWNIPVNASIVERLLNDNTVMSNSSNLTQPSDVTTPERISDLDLVESKLSNLKFLQFETSL